MKTHRTDSVINIRNNYLKKINKKEKSIISKRSNFLDSSVHQVAESYNQKLNLVKMNFEKENKVIISS